MKDEFLNLLDLQRQLRAGLEELFPKKCWVKAEISSVSARMNGHCYLELSQSEGTAVVAKASAVIWRGRYVALSQYFRTATGSELKVGMTILVRAQVSFSEIYGLTLVIDDIDAEVTLGQKELQRRQTLERLRQEGLMELQQELALPLLPYRLAVISARDAAGFGDFTKHLLSNEFGFSFEVDLFEAAVQGDAAPQSISAALDAVQESEKPYDVALIMRGGGSNLDLDCFDDYSLAASIARCTVPVLTAIGHQRDCHIADLVAHAHVKTPTALADLLLDCYMAEDENIASYISRLRLAFQNKLYRMESAVESLRQRIESADPRKILSRGYSLTLNADGVVMKDAAKVQPGDKISVMFADGTLKCKVYGKI